MTEILCARLQILCLIQGETDAERSGIGGGESAGKDCHTAFVSIQTKYVLYVQEGLPHFIQYNLMYKLSQGKGC